MALQNAFLGAKPKHNRLLEGCFCEDCRLRRCARYTGLNNRGLFQLFVRGLPRLENEQLLKCHETVLNMIVAGKLYKENCLRNTQYEQFKSWANKQPQFADWDERSLKRFSDAVNEADIVYRSWEVIVSNLMDPRMDYLDARRFSLGQFRQAKDLGWCLLQNERQRRNARRGDSQYDEQKYQSLLQIIKTFGILDDFDHDPHVAAMLMRRLSSDIVKYCKP